MDIRTKQVCTNIEKAFNIAGSLPVISKFSGMLRFVAGKVQAVAGAIIALTGVINYTFTKDRLWKNVALFGAEFMIHGALNAIRGLTEAFICIKTLVGNLVLLIPNMTKDDIFSPYCEYGILTERNGLLHKYVT
jgi:hypothetical protein